MEMLTMSVKRIFHALAAVITSWSVLAGVAWAQPSALRICGDPDNLPFSNDKLEGFENKVAAVIAADLGAAPTYVWWPNQMGLVRNTINAGTCDVLFGVPAGLDLVLWTKPYYRTAYVIAYRTDRGYDISSLNAPALKGLRLGVYANTPPEEGLALRGLGDNLTLYPLFFDHLGTTDRPIKLLEDLVAGVVDVAVPWGPIAGYFTKQFNAPLRLVPLENQDEPGVPLAFDISMGVAKGNAELKTRLEAAIDRRQAEIRSILAEYGIPLISAHAPPGGQEVQTTQASAPQESAPPTTNTLNPFTGKAEMIAEGKGLYVKVGCQGCHGGGGGGGMAVSLIDAIWKFGSDDDTLYKLIKGEIPQQTMPTVYSTLPDDQAWKILAFIRSLYIGDASKINW
jgi:mxaJ protein